MTLSRTILLSSLLLCARLCDGQSKFDEAMALYNSGDSLYQITSGYSKEAEEFLGAASEIFFEIDSNHWAWRCALLRSRQEVWHGRQSVGLEMAISTAQDMERLSAHDTLRAEVYYIAGAALHRLGRPEEAVDPLSKASNLFKGQGSTQKKAIEAFWYMAYIYESLGQLDIALAQYKESVMMAEALSPSRYRSRTLFSLYKNTAIIYGERLGNLRESMRLLSQCGVLVDENPEYMTVDHRRDVFNTMSNVHRKLGNFEKSLEYAQQSMAIEGGDPSRPSFRLKFAKYHTALALSELRRYHEANAIYKELLTMRFYPDWQVKHIGENYLDMEELDSATLYMRKVLAIERQKDGTKSSLPQALLRLGQIHEQRGDYDSMAYYIRESIDVSLPSSRHFAYKLLSRSYYKRGLLDSALHFARIAVFGEDLSDKIEINLEHGRTGLIDRGRWLLELYENRADEKAESVSAAIDYCYQLQDYLSDQPYLARTATQTHIIYQEGVRNTLKMATWEDPIWAREAFVFAEWSKMQVLAQAWRGSEARQYGAIPQELIDLENDLLLQQNYVSSQVQKMDQSQDSSNLNSYKARLFRLRHSRDSLQTVFETTYPRYHQLRYSNDSLSVQDVQRRLANNEAFIEYFVGDTVSYVFLITEDQYEVKQIDLVNDSLTNTLRASLKSDVQSHSPQEFQAQALPIYEQYLRPVIDQLGPEIDELIIVPDGNLSYFPLGALVNASTKNPQTFQNLSYLMDDYTIHYAYSASLYFNEFTSLSDNNDLLAFAPSYETTLQDATRMEDLGQFRNQISSLVHTLPEVNAISEYFSGQTFTGAEASESTFKSNIGQQGILHLAMHAIVDDEDPMNSRMLFYNDEDTLEDGFLHAFEIYNMRIPSKMTVLSACETGYGKMAKGEGAMSLARAFAYAGSPSIVMSHWQVDDESTAVLMTHFYKHLSEGASKGAAMRQARKDFLEQADITRSHPFFWASFVVVGDDSPIGSSWTTTLYWVLGTLLFLVLATYVSRSIVRRSR